MEYITIGYKLFYLLIGLIFIFISGITGFIIGFNHKSEEV